MRVKSAIGRAAERGAAGVEYALVLSVFVVVVATGLDGLTATTTDAVEERGDRIGNPENFFTPVDPGGDTGATIGEDIIPPPSGPIALRLDDLANRRSAGYDPKWQASVDVVVTESTGAAGMPGITVEGEWRIKSNNGWKTVAAYCSTDTNGRCTMTVDGLQLNGAKPDDEAWFWLTTIVADGVNYTYDGTIDTTTYGIPPDGPAVLICRPGLAIVPDPPNPDTCV